MVAVGFDFDHTLGLDHGLERRALGRLAERLGAPIDLASAAETARLEHLLQPFRSAVLPMDAMIARFVASLEPPLDAANGAASALANEYREICYDLVDELVVALDGARELLEALVTAGVRVGILTNGWSQLQEKKIARAIGAFPGPILVSDVIGAYKPSSDAFRQLERALGCSASELWYVGDNPVADIGGAQAYGVRAIWLDRDGIPYPADLAPPDARVENLTDVLAIIRGS